MPGTNGFDLQTLLRKSNIGNSRTIPVMVMTARGVRDKEAFLHTGYFDMVKGGTATENKSCNTIPKDEKIRFAVDWKHE